MIEDIATLVGCEVVSEETGSLLESVELHQLGSAKSIRVEKERTTILEGGGQAQKVRARITSIKKQIDETTSDYDREKLQERMAKLAGGVAVIHVGAATETELKEKKHRLEDALSATRAAVEDGIVVGGGISLLRSADYLAQHMPMSISDEEKAGVKIVIRALEEPIRQIAENAGLDGSIVAERARNEKPGMGFDAASMEWRDMYAAGIVDPTKVVVSALRNAASIAGIALMSECSITDAPEKE